MMAMTERLHHMAFRCRDSEETRIFYEEVIGLPLAAAMPIEASATGRAVRVMHTFFQLRDGSFVAFFEVPGAPFEFKEQHDFDLHMALEADQDYIDRATAAAKARGIEVRGPSEHGFIRSTYFRDPNGYVVELALKTHIHDSFEAEAPKAAHAILAAWRARNAELAGA
jgi:catechol 2,3-dioxygenase-like lactoylglutathione lyase family enzyme